MHIKITAQKIGQSFETYNNSVRDYVNYLEKENEDRDLGSQEHFFDQNNDKIPPEKVIAEIDGNTAKLKKREPKFYSIVVSPSQRELKHINNNPEFLKKYTRELMKDYAASFYRDRKISVNDLKYYAKIEHKRSYRGFEKKIMENAPYRKEIAKLKNEMAKVERGISEGNLVAIQKKIDLLQKQAPHKLNGELLVEGMEKEGVQTHVHIIISRKDVTNTYSLSPGSKYKANTTLINGKKVKQGFHRDKFYDAAEKRFDTLFGYNRNFVEKYAKRKLFRHDPAKFFAAMAGLPTSEKQVALKLLYKTGVNIPNIPANKAQLAFKAFMKLKKGIEVALRSGTIKV